MASTKVPEFAEVMKNVHNSMRDTTHRIIPRGYLPITMNSPVSGLLAISASWATESVPSIPKCRPRLPIMANQRMDPRAGASTTPAMNSRIVLPLEIRAMNDPTNGAHAIHHAQ